MKWIVLILLITLCNCSRRQVNASEPSKPDFTIRADRLYLPVSIDGHPLIELLFDTGTLVGCLISATAAGEYTDSIQPRNDLASFNGSEIEIHGLPLGTRTIHYVPETGIALIAPSYATDTRIWCFDMDNEKFSIRETDTLPAGALVFPLVFASYRSDRRLMPFVNIPMTIRSGKDSIKTDYGYTISLFRSTEPSGET